MVAENHTLSATDMIVYFRRPTFFQRWDNMDDPHMIAQEAHQMALHQDPRWMNASLWCISTAITMRCAVSERSLVN